MQKKGLLEIHIATLLFALAGLFGKYLSLSPILIVFGRTLFAAAALGFAIVVSKQAINFKARKHALALILLGVLLAVHWITFFQSIQVSTVAIGLLTFSTFPIFVTFIEPLIIREKIYFRDVLIAVVVFIGLLMVIPSFDFANNVTLGAAWGTISGFTFALLTVWNRKLVTDYPPLIIVFWQNSVAALVTFPFVLDSMLSITTRDFWLIAFLGVICTALAHTLFIRGLEGIKAQLASVITSLQPVYGIVLAMLLLKEIPSFRTICGGIIIVAATIAATSSNPVHKQ